MAIEKQIAGGVALVKEQRGGLYVWDEVDADGSVLARDRYALAASAPFSLTQAEKDTGVADGVFTVTDPAGPTLAEIHAEKWEAIRTKRDYLTDNGGYLVGTKWFHSDAKSRSQQLGLVLLGANIPAGTQWKTMDGTFVTMTQALAGQILAAAAASDIAIFSAAEAHRAAMLASQDPGNYDYDTGWPAVFAG